MTFDPYHKWLGIPAAEQPANNYRLLAIALFEDDPDVIETAADQRMALLRTFQTGQHSALSQKLLNELSAARLCLLTPAKKAAYDADLRRRVDAAQSPQPALPRARPLPAAAVRPAAPAQPLGPTLVTTEAPALIVTDDGAARHSTRKRGHGIGSTASAWLALAAVAIPAAIFIGYLISTKPKPGQAIATTRTPKESTLPKPSKPPAKPPAPQPPQRAASSTSGGQGEGHGSQTVVKSRKIEIRETPATTSEPRSPLSTPVEIPAPIARWDFSRSGVDEVGELHCKLHGGAKLAAGRLQLPGGDAFASTPPIKRTLTAKTLEAWVALANLNQRGGGVMSLQTLNGGEFDAIVYGESEPRRWIAGSDWGRRRGAVAGPLEVTADGRLVHVAIVYRDDGEISVFRNGQRCGEPYRNKAVQPFEAGKAQVLFGLRHSPLEQSKLLSGSIAKARLYDVALTPEQIAVLAADAPPLTAAPSPASATTTPNEALKPAEPQRTPRDFVELGKENAPARKAKLTTNEAVTLRGHTAAVTRIAFHRTMPLLASAGKDGQVLLWNLQNRAVQFPMHKFREEAWAVKFSPEGLMLACANRNWWGSRLLFKTLAGQQLNEIKDFKNGGGAVVTIAYSPDGRLFAAGQDDGTIRLWDIRQFREITPVGLGEGHNVYNLAFGPVTEDRKNKRTDYLLAEAGQDGQVRTLAATVAITNIGPQWIFKPTAVQFPKSGPVFGLRFSPDGKLLGFTRAGGHVCLCDPRTGAPVRALAEGRGGGGSVEWIAFHPQRPWCVTAHRNDQVARIWNTDTAELLCELKGHTGGVMCAEFSPDGRQVATASEDFSIKLWDLSGAGVPAASKKGKKAKLSPPTVGD